MALTVTLLGGESSGKTTLAQALHRRLDTELRMPTALVPEQLRLWCQRHGRAPLAHEQAERASEQARAIDATAASDATQVVIADTTAMVVAAYSELYFNDRSLWPEAIARQRPYDLTLLMGLDLPWVADGLFRDGPALREATDTLLRRELQAAGIPFQTLYGPLQARVQQALRTIGAACHRPLVPENPAWTQGRRPWTCDTCSDPDCEHRLFTRRLQQPGNRT